MKNKQINKELRKLTLNKINITKLNKSQKNQIKGGETGECTLDPSIEVC
ncbi:class I lanthipeptide [Aquimarina aggregata]